MYAKQNLFAHHLRALRFVSVLSGFAFLAAAPALRAASLEDAPHELAIKVCAAAHKQAVHVQWQESGGSAGYWSEDRKQAFLDQISACGFAPTANAEAPVLRVRAEFTPSRLLLLAESGDAANGPEIHMVEVPRNSPLGPRESSSGPRLEGELLWQQDQRISSAVEWQDPASHEDFLFLLSDGKLLRLQNANAAWSVVDSAELPPARKPSRTGDGNFAYQYTGHPLDFLRDTRDGNICTFPPSGPLSIKCAPQNLIGQPLLLASPCEPLPRVLSSGDGDFTQPDQLLLLGPVRESLARISKDNPSSAVNVPGPVLGISLAEKDAAAFAVVRNLSTGNYEVYRITAVCGN